jgi:acyl-CoA thioester hydrolase
MWDEGHTKLKSLMWVNFVYVSMTTKRAKDHDATLLELFEQVCIPIEQSTFEIRVQQFAR